MPLTANEQFDKLSLKPLRKDAMSEMNETERTPKPKAVKIVEAFAWVYVALSVAVFGAAVVVPFMRSFVDAHVIVEGRFWVARAFPALLLLCLPFTMLRAVRRGRYAGFYVPHIAFSLFLTSFAKHFFERRNVYGYDRYFGGAG